MLKRIISGAVASTLSAALLAGCGSGGGSQAVPSTPGSGGSKTTNAKFTIRIPGTTAPQMKNGKKLPLYVSRNTKGIGVEFGASPDAAFGAGNAPSTSPAVAASIAPGAAGCDPTAQADGSFNCTVYLPGVPVGYNDLRITLWDAAPSSGSFSGDHSLSIYVATNIVTLAGIDNTLGPFTTLPVVDSAYVQLTAGIVDGTASAVTGYVVAKDAQGNIILGGDTLVDANYNNVTLTPAISGGPSLKFTAPSANPAYTTAGTNAFTLNYDGSVELATSGVNQPSVSVSDTTGGVANFQGSSLQVTDSHNGITVPGQPQVAPLYTYGAAPTGMTVGSDAALWVVNGGNISRTTTGGSNNDFDNVSGGVVGTPGLIAAGSEGFLWYTDTANNKIARFAPVSSGAISVTETPAIAGAALTGIALGPDGNMWFGDSAHAQLDMVDPNAFSAAWSLGVNQFSLASAPTKVKAGPLFNSGTEKSVCAVEPGAPGVQCLDLSTHSITGVATSATPVSLVVGPDNKLYVGEVGKIEVFTVSGSTFAAGSASYPLAAAGTPQVQSINVSQDGNMWFVETGATNPTFGNLNIQSATPTLNEFGTNTNMPAGATPYQILLDSANGVLYFTDSSANNQLDTITP